MKDQAGARSRAQKFFPVSERRDEMVMAEIARDRAAVDAKTIKLRALRLAKEETDRIAKAEHDAAHPPATRKPKVRRKAAETAAEVLS